RLWPLYGLTIPVANLCHAPSSTGNGTPSRSVYPRYSVAFVDAAMAHASGSLSRFQQKSHVPCAIRASVAAVGWTASQASPGKRSGEWVTQSIFVPVLAESRARNRGVDLRTSPCAPSLIITPRRFVG